MATINIIDTGWLNLTRSGTQSTRANGGTSVALPAASIQLKADTSVESSVLPGMIDTTAQPIGYNSPVLSVTVMLRNNVSADREVFKDLCGVYGDTSYPGFHRTRGIKLLYVTTSTDVRKSALELYGSSSGLYFHGGEISTGQAAVPGYVMNLSWTDVPSTNMIRVSFDFQVA